MKTLTKDEMDRMTKEYCDSQPSDVFFAANILLFRMEAAEAVKKKTTKKEFYLCSFLVQQGYCVDYTAAYESYIKPVRKHAKKK